MHILKMYCITLAYIQQRNAWGMAYTWFVNLSDWSLKVCTYVHA